ncbi:hypothetical protein [Methylomonas koyamae]|uniref:hypothetical protein n=1 Tax=Methylomonas koyamae TaxID=702114 RepID=UPI002872F89E|nr:hypothetical protein [Methylomonas koyamae]WNB74599.1 hypothetical protein RI210_15055 [Methylomonas koyamae]
MTSDTRTEFGRKENHLVNATLIVDGVEVNGVPCKIYLPERIDEKPYVIIKPSEDDATDIMSSQSGSLRAVVLGFADKEELVIDSPEVYFDGMSKKFWGSDISENTIPGEPQDLHVVRPIQLSEGSEKTQIVFWVTPNSFLSPSMGQLTSYSGDLEYKRTHNLNFTLRHNVSIYFDKHFLSKTSENGDFIQWGFLVACVETEIPAIDASTIKETVLPDVDDFLLIASFVARQRTACLGWSASDGNSLTNFYRGYYTFPKIETNTSVHDGVIDPAKFEEFMNTCYQAFVKYENKLALRNALFSLVPSNSLTLEVSFLNMFAGLETLILDFKRQKSLEFVLENDQWSSLKKYLEKCIKNSTEPTLEAEQRKLLYSKLDELNRVSLREAFESFCQYYSIQLEDLWPIFGKNKLAGLSDIRNKFIHGDPFGHEMYDPIILAHQHLKYVLERVLIRIFQWNVDETRVSPTYLSTNMIRFEDMLANQKKLSDFIYPEFSLQSSTNSD